MGRKLTLALMKEGLGTSDDDVVLRATSLRLNELDVEEVDNLELITQVRDLYLHRNAIKLLPDMSCLFGLRFLALQRNAIATLKGANLATLKSLEFLDVSQNLIRELDAQDLPRDGCLQILKFVGNPVEKDADLPAALGAAIASLVEVNGSLLRGAAEDEESKVEQAAPTRARPSAAAGGAADDKAFTAELEDLKAGLSAPGYTGLQAHGGSATAGTGGPGAAVAELHDSAARFSDKRAAIIARYKAELDSKAGTLADMARLAAEETAGQLAAARERLKKARDAALARSHERSAEAQGQAKDAADRLKKAEAQAAADAEEGGDGAGAEPVWKRVLARLPEDPDLAGHGGGLAAADENSGPSGGKGAAGSRGSAAPAKASSSSSRPSSGTSAGAAGGGGAGAVAQSLAAGIAGSITGASGSGRRTGAKAVSTGGAAAGGGDK